MEDKLGSQLLAQDFLKVAEQFKLGNLPTETPHELTKNLSQDSKNNISNAINTILKLDKNVFSIVDSKIHEIEKLQLSILDTLNSGGNIYLCGCGATGRLSLALETIWRLTFKEDQLKDRIISFMAGGDVALIHSVEKFEDFPEFGERQLYELGFKDGDLLISTTEGGETPFVIGATEASLAKSFRTPYFIYCNPDDVLIRTTERSKNVIENSKINKINLTVGPMALTGSTRMQATTVLMYSVGLALLNYNKSSDFIKSEISKIRSFIDKSNFNFLEKFIVKESEIYQNKEFLYYETDKYLGISILTDTTERSPTFSLYPFENQNDDKKNPSLSYLLFPHTNNSAEAWKDLLLRSPRTFHWKEVTAQTSGERLDGFDFSHKLLHLRKSYLNIPHHHFKIYFVPNKNEIHFHLDQLEEIFSCNDLSFLSVHMVLKMALNTLSTIIMGRLDRYESNLMTWVRASNNKLVDRAVRYATILLKDRGISVSYEDLVKSCFEFKDSIPRDESLVLKLVDIYSKK